MTDSRSQFDPLEALTVKEVAELLHVSRPTVEKHIKTGELPSVTIGRCRRILRSDVEAFIQVRRTHGWQDYRPESARQGDYRHGADGFADNGDEIPY